MVRLPIPFEAREEDGGIMLALLVTAPFVVVLVLFLVALFRCQRNDIPAVMATLAAVLKALTRWGRE